MLFNNDMNGACQDSKPKCEQMLGQLRASATDPSEQLGACTRTTTPVCLDKTANGTTERVCHPTSATCRTHAAYFEHEGATVSECRSSDPKATAEPRWWCVSYEPASVGSCTPALKDCEASRDFLRGKVPGETIECRAQATAECVELETKGGKREMCHPSSKICKATVETMAEDGITPTINCHTK